MTFVEYTETDFRNDSVDSGEAELLISGSSVLQFTSGSNPAASSWPYLESSDMVWNKETSGDIGEGYIEGIKISFKDQQGNDIRRSYQICDSILLEISTGDSMQRLELDVLDRSMEEGHVYFRVHYPLAAIQGAFITFRSTGEGSEAEYDGYECHANYSADGSKMFTSITVTPQFSRITNTVFDPEENNVTGSVENTYATEPGTDTRVEIPDSFYTALSNVSGRFLGSKTGYETCSASNSSSAVSAFITNYTGNKAELSNNVLRLVESHRAEHISGSQLPDDVVVLGTDPAFFTVREIEGSILNEETEKVPNVSEMTFETLKFTVGPLYKTGSIGESGSYIRTYNPTVPAVPGKGSVLYKSDLKHRVVSSRVFLKDTETLLTTNEYGYVLISGSAV